MGTLANDTIILNSGIKYLRNKIFTKINDLPVIYNYLLQFNCWNNELHSNDIKIKNFTDKKHDTVISNGIYSDEHCGDYGLFIELSDNNYQLYHKDGEEVILEISSGKWMKTNNIVKFKDDDNLNIFEINILDKETICPTKRLPFTSDISPLKLNLIQNDKSIVSNMNSSKDIIQVYSFSEKRITPHSNEIESITYLTFDLNKSRYQINQIGIYEDSGQEKLVSQGSLKIINDVIELIDKNNSLLFRGSLVNDTIILNIGIKYLKNKIFTKISDFSGMWMGEMKFYNWNNIYMPKVNYKISDIDISSDIYSGIYSSEYFEENSKGLFIELTDCNYEIYFIDGDSLKFEISSGKLIKNQDKLQLQDEDNLNILDVNILDKETICPSKIFPFTNDISSLKLKKK